MGPLADLGFRRGLPLLAPETADAEERVGTLQQAADRTRIGPPRRVVALAVVRPRQRDEIEQRAQLEVLRFVDERLRAGVLVWLPGHGHGPEDLR